MVTATVAVTVTVTGTVADADAGSGAVTGTVSASRSTGLLVRLRRPGGPAARRPSVAPSAWSRERRLKDCDHADSTPAASLVAWRGALERCTAGVARLDIVRSAERSRMVIVGTMSNPARPGGGHIPAVSEAAPARWALFSACSDVVSGAVTATARVVVAAPYPGGRRESEIQNSKFKIHNSALSLIP